MELTFQRAARPVRLPGLNSTDKLGSAKAPGEREQVHQPEHRGESLTSATEGPWKGCAKTSIVPMTYKRANVEAGITAMVAAGNTLIAEGIAWGWRVLSPTEPFTKVEASTSFPADTISTYHHPRWLKIMVVMTDGDNDISAGWIA